MKQVYIKDKLGNAVLPMTSFGAVRNNNGDDLYDALNAKLDSLNFTQNTEKYLREDGTWNIPASTSTTYKFTIGSTTNGDSVNGTSLGTLQSETAEANGTTLSLVTTGEKAIWNSAASNAGTVTGIKVGSSGSTLSPTDGIITIPAYPTSSDIVTSTTVKSALGTGSGTTKFLREDGTWVVPSYTSNDGNTLYYLTLNGSTNGTASTTNLGTVYAPSTAGTSGQYLASSGSGEPTWTNFPTIPTNTNQLTNGAGFISSVPSDYKKSYAVVVSVSADRNNEGIPSGVTLGDGDECTVIYQNSGSADYTVAMATSGFITQDGNALELTCPNGGYCEVNFLKIGSTVYLRGV